LQTSSLIDGPASSPVPRAFSKSDHYNSAQFDDQRVEIPGFLCHEADVGGVGEAGQRRAVLGPQRKTYEETKWKKVMFRRPVQPRFGNAWLFDLRDGCHR